jgi:hypothetical protein
MKKLTAIGFLLLLLYQLIGLPMALLRVEKVYVAAVVAPPAEGQFRLVKSPISLPDSAWQNLDGQPDYLPEDDPLYHIVQQNYLNDTLYTLLRTDQNARERFWQLAELLPLQGQEDSKAALGQLLKLLRERLTTYVLPGIARLTQPDLLTRSLRVGKRTGGVFPYRFDLPVVSPPPES